MERGCPTLREGTYLSNPSLGFPCFLIYGDLEINPMSGNSWSLS